VIVGEIISFPWFSKELKNDLLKNNYLPGVIPYTSRPRINIRWVGVSVSNNAIA
jgi:hypothetical protein